ncbi:hypothetical protein FH972_021711 [Carpinus fangiana]|uniref:histidine kinase n=1 Tax=Carpinus fangiana TaxID=176857 RepID=A0A5N6KQ36_9ROSI|nr:hypothetical protein FH972_021711 [Carpinus fangiana]
MTEPRSIFTVTPPQLLAQSTVSGAGATAPLPRPTLKRRFSEAARDLRGSGHLSSTFANGNHSALTDLRARAVYGVPLPSAPALHEDTPPLSTVAVESGFKAPAAPSRGTPETPPSSTKFAGRKRATPETTRLPPAAKRLRLDRAHHTADSILFHRRRHDNALPATPLFFSNSPQLRPQLPPRFSSSEAAAKMLSKAQSDETGVKTVKLARGKLGSPPAQRPTPSRSRNSSGRFSQARSTASPDPSIASENYGVLSQIGVLELLDQDERPTFIVDLGDDSNFVSPGLHLVFSNHALRSREDTLANVMGSGEEDEDPTLEASSAFVSFKTWVLSPAASTNAPEDIPSKCTHAGMLWTGSILRRRLRVLSGTPLADSNHDSSSSDPFPIPSASVASMSAYGGSNAGHVSLPSAGQEPTSERIDYFGSTSSRPLTTATISETLDASDVIPSTELASKESSIVATDGSVIADPSPLPNTDMANQPPGFGLDAVLSAASASDLDRFANSGEKEVGFFDWTRLPVSDGLPRHIKFARSVDWAATALGPIETWSPDLRQMCNLIMASPHPAAMYWGEDLVAIYNEAYVLLAGQKHPTLMGQSYREAWSEIWDEVKDVFASAQTTGQATMKDDDCLFIKRNDFLEETYFSWSIIPMVGGDGTVHGLYNPAFEKTRRKIAERRMLTLREVGERTATARDVKGFWDAVLQALETNEFDTPFVLLYSLSDDTDSEESSMYSSSLNNTAKQCYLEGGLGVPAGHPSAPDVVDFSSSMEGFIPAFREVVKTNRHKLFECSKGQLDPSLLDGLESRGFGDPARSVVVCPIHPTTGESTLGFLVMGVNSRRPYDDDYNLFVQLLSRQLATSLASVVLFEEEIRRGQRAAKLAALDRIQLSEQLAARTQEAIESETKFTRMAEFAPVGMFIADTKGRITYCNDTWYDITRVPKGDKNVDRWTDYVSDGDKALVASVWLELVEQKKPTSAEFRFKTPWVDRNGVFSDTWVLFSAFPEKTREGSLKSVFGCITNISQQKWAEGFQKRKMEEAVELKRQQENFIDITSHEMRNPLSAILQCSDEIMASLSNAKQKGSPPDAALLDDNIDAAQTIALCAQHQKRIVDDVLTMSKLDSALLMVTPIDVQPLTVAQRALKMFENELQTADIDLKFVVDDSFKKLGIDWVRFDPSRVLQVLINLTTNAIKFTTTENKKNITVSIAASLQKPSEDGRGLAEEEKKLLFQRFSQASPRTHVQYGGSGLGLFISRELTELQGGEIGVASEAGKGSTFAFYVMAKRSTAPENLGDVDMGPLSRVPSNSKKLTGKARKAQPQASQARDFAPALTGTGQKLEARLKVLIVEDNLVNQRVLQRQLKNLGCEVHVANHGGEALDVLQKSQYWSESKGAGIELNVVLMDQEMPVMDGLTCTKKIRELEAAGKFTKHVPIIAVTANARSEQIRTLMEAGMVSIQTAMNLLVRRLTLAAGRRGIEALPRAGADTKDRSRGAQAARRGRHRAMSGAGRRGIWRAGLTRPLLSPPSPTRPARPPRSPRASLTTPTDPSPVDSHGSASTQATDIDDTAEDQDSVEHESGDATPEESDDREDKDKRGAPSPLSPQATLARVDTDLAARVRADSETGPQSVIHAPQDFARSFETVTESKMNRVTPSPTDRSETTIVSPRSPEDSTPVDKVNLPTPSLQTHSNSSRSSQQKDTPTSLLKTDVPAVKDRSTPRAQTRQEAEEEWKRRSKRNKSLEGTTQRASSDTPGLWSTWLADIPEGQDGDRADEDDDTLAGSTDLRPQTARVSDEQLAQIESLKAALSECWTLTNTLANLSSTHRTRVFNYRGPAGMQETAWQKCWKLCKELYNTRDSDPTDHVLSTLSMCREFCTALFDARRKEDEMADSVLRVSFELNQHLFNTQDPNIGSVFQERTLEFYLTICHRLMKQRTSLPEETDALLRACWSLAEMLFSIRQSNREGKPADEDLLGSAVQACWELCDLFREGWTQVRPDRGTPRAQQTNFTLSQGSFGRSQSAFSNHSSPSLTRSGSTSHSYPKSFPPETPTTIFDDATDDEQFSPDKQAPNILVLGPPDQNSNSSHHRQPFNSQGWSSAASTHSFASDSTTRSSSAKQTAALQANMACIRILLVKAASVAGYKPAAYSPPTSGASSTSSLQSTSNPIHQSSSAASNAALKAFIKELPSSVPFGTLPWQAALAQHVKELVLKWHGLVQHVGAGGDLGDGRLLPGVHEASGAKAKRNATAGEIARAVQWMMRSEQYTWMSGLYRVVFGFGVEEASSASGVAVVQG